MKTEERLHEMLSENYTDEDKETFKKWIELIAKERDFQETVLSHKIVQEFVEGLGVEIEKINNHLLNDRNIINREQLLDRRDLYTQFKTLFEVGNKEQQITKLI